jgi:hypothetical protein
VDSFLPGADQFEKSTGEVEGPEGCCTWENQNAKANAAANRLRIDTFHAGRDEGNREK